jgi:RNA polymerase sigma factor (sigma-70 family)
MENRRLNTVVQQLYHLAAGPLTDAQLLSRFVSRRDEAAFELLVRRHGALVWGVCRRILGNAADADDAFQAAFLVLVRRASSVDRTRPLSAWLHGVACRVALRARSTARRRNYFEHAAGQNHQIEKGPDNAAEVHDLRRVLDQELDRLPEVYRTPLILCCLQGLTQQQAAEHLGCPLGTLKCRVRRGQARLRDRLSRRGLAPSSDLAIATKLAPPAIVAGTVTAALHLTAGSAQAGIVSIHAVTLANGVLKAMTIAKVKTISVLLLTITFVAAGIGGLSWISRDSGIRHGAALATDDGTKGSTSAKPPDKSDSSSEAAPVSEKLQALWTDLVEADEAVAWRAAFELAAQPGDSIKLFKGRLKPVVVDAESIKKLIRDLDNDSFDVRERASAELKSAGESAVPYMRKALAEGASAETKQRLEVLLNSSKRPAGPTARSVRAAAVLEAIGGEDARRILESIAKGDEEAPQTRAAKAALGRLDGKPAGWDARWDALNGHDEAAALRAALAAVAAPKEVLPFFKEKADKPLRAPVTLKRLAVILQKIDTAEAREVAEKFKKEDTRSALAPDGRSRVDVDENGNLLKTDVASGKIIWKMSAPGGGSTCCAFSPDGKTIAAGGKDGSLQVIDGATGKLIMQMKGHQAAVQSVTYSPDGKTMTSSDGNKAKLTWDLATGKLIATSN